ncbi:hypothetical protein [Methylobacterium iners]|uniref:Uncharacterized protein n=1 Tax=Methylobacterium iners TaxID=418707 RepID=A0ABQ4S126_9HYPH|nr:hypothetical protein [Methylobacterium iners]GJD96815.1 hypothetical protein OCOJLMKI_4040 [Methylobacterium iners]
MRARFTVIEGGAGGQSAVEAETLGGEASWRIDLHRPAAVGEAEVAAWRALLTRLRVAEPFRADPDYLLTAAQHQARSVDLVFAFAWNSLAGREHLQAVIPLAMPHRLWGNGVAEIWHPPGLTIGPSIDPDRGEKVREALLDHLRGIQPVRAIALDPQVRRPSLFERTIAPVRSARRAAIPPDSVVGVRPFDAFRSPPPETERIADPERIRDAVEMYLGLDARFSPSPLVNDPSEATMVRVVMRRFAQRRLASVDVMRRDGAAVAARLRLGIGPQALIWRAVDTESGRPRSEASA